MVWLIPIFLGVAVLASMRPRPSTNPVLRDAAQTALRRIQSRGYGSREDYETLARFFGSIDMPNSEARFLELARNASTEEQYEAVYQVFPSTRS